MNCTELISDVKAAIGRETDTVLITDDRVLSWLNKAQEEIAEQCPGLLALDIKNTTSVDFTQTLSYSLSDFTSPLPDITTENRICHLYQVYYVDGNESQKLQFIPSDLFDSRYIDPTSSDVPQGKPRVFTRRGSTIEVFPICSTAECDKTLRIDGSVYPVDFTASDSAMSSSLERADDILISYAIFKSWSYVGKADNAGMWLSKFNGLVENYKTQNDTLHEWDANIYGEWV